MNILEIKIQLSDNQVIKLGQDQTLEFRTPDNDIIHIIGVKLKSCSIKTAEETKVE